MDINEIREAIQANQVIVSRHAGEEAAEDSLAIAEVCFSVNQGDIIKDYPEDRPYPSCLIYGDNQNGEPVHSVWSYNQDTGWAVLITVYRPDPNQWINWRTRRRT